MTTAFLNAPQVFLAASTVGRDRTFSSIFCQVKISSALKPNGVRLSARCHGFPRKVSPPVKAQHNSANSFVDDDDFRALHSGSNCVDDDVESLLDSSIHIWWDFVRRPLPLNFDASNIRNTVVDTVRRINAPGPIFFRGYGIDGDLFPKLYVESLKILLESGFQVIGFQMTDNYSSRENLMISDLFFSVCIYYPDAIHMVASDGKSSTVSDLDELRGLGHEIIEVHPEQDAMQSVSLWEPLSARVTSREHDEQNFGNSFDGGHLHGFSCKSNDTNNAALNVTCVQGGQNPVKIVNVWWDAAASPVPSNSDARNTLVKVLKCINMHGPIFFRVYGIIPEIGEDVGRFICASGFQLSGILLKDCNYDNLEPAVYENLLAADCLNYLGHVDPPSIHMFISDGNEEIELISDSFHRLGCKIISLHLLS